MIEKIIYPSKRILILDGNLFQLTVIYTNPKGTIFLFTNKIGPPQSETLGRMKLLSNRSFDYYFKYFNSTGAILYDGIEIG